MDNVRVEFDLSKGDMPNSVEFAKYLKNFPDFSVFPQTDKDLINRLDKLIEKEIPNIVCEAENVENEVRLGKRSAATEEKKEDAVEKKEPMAEVKDETEKTSDVNSINIFGLLGKIAVFCLLILSALEGVHYWAYSALSFVELHDGYKQLFDELSQHPKVSELRLTVERRQAASPAGAPLKKSSPLSSLPTKTSNNKGSSQSEL